jgi:phosphohistidine phosphatase
MMDGHELMKALLLLRHAKSSWDSSRLDDHDRPLNERGRRDGPRMGAVVRQHGLTPDVIITSDAVRARLTAAAVAKSAGYAGEIVMDPRLYLASPNDIVDVLRTVRGTKTATVMIVGHNPGLEELLARMTGESEDMPTAALAHIVLPIHRWRDLDGGIRGTLVALWRPRLITSV